MLNKTNTSTLLVYVFQFQLREMLEERIQNKINMKWTLITMISHPCDGKHLWLLQLYVYVRKHEYLQSTFKPHMQDIKLKYKKLSQQLS